MPFSGEHSCRLKPPTYKRYARKNCYQKHDGKCIDYVFGINKPNESELQSMRYKKDVWDEDDARRHCKSNDGTFEPAAEDSTSAEMPHRWYSMKAADENSAEIEIFDAIGGWTGITVDQFKKDFDAVRGKKSIRLLLNSPGGDVFDGMAIYNLLGRDREKLEVQVLGIAASIASIIALAGHELIMSKGSYLVIHRPHGLALGDASDMRKQAEVLEKIEGQMAKIYASESNLSREEALAAMAEETWYTANEAMEAGFADSVVDYGDVAAMAFDLNGFKHVPEAIAAKIQRARSLPAVKDTSSNPAHSGGDESVTEGGEEVNTIKEILEAFAKLPAEEKAKATEEEKKQIAEVLGFDFREAQFAELEMKASELSEQFQPLKADRDQLAGKAEALEKVNQQLAAQVTELQVKERTRRKTEAIEAALKEGRVPPVDRAFWEKRLEADLDGTEEILKKLPASQLFSEIGTGAGGGEGNPMLTDKQRKALKALGVSDEKIAAIEKEGI